MPGGSELADEAVGQEEGAKQVLDRLDKLEAWDEGFEKLLREFIAAARDHVAFEETKVWPGLREALSTEEINELGEQLMKAKEHGTKLQRANSARFSRRQVGRGEDGKPVVDQRHRLFAPRRTALA